MQRLPERAVVPGQIYAAAILHHDAGKTGVPHFMWASRRNARRHERGKLVDVTGNFTPGFRQHVEATFSGAILLAESFCDVKGTRNWAYDFHLGFEAHRTDGTSSGLPIALAFLSLFLDRPVPDYLVASGATDTVGRDFMLVGHVGDVVEKVEGCAKLPMILPRENRIELRHSARRSDPSIAFVSSVNEAVELLWGGKRW